MNKIKNTLKINNLNEIQLRNYLMTQFRENQVIIYGSEIEGRTSKFSDLDVYVIEDIREKQATKTLKLKTLILDIEYVKIDTILSIIQKVNNKSNLRLEELKLLYRLREGIFLSNIEILDRDIFSNLEIDEAIKFYWSQKYISLNDDILKAHMQGKYEESLLQLIKLVEIAECIYLCNYHRMIVKEKWIHDDFIKLAPSSLVIKEKEKLQNLIMDISEEASNEMIRFCNKIRFL